MHSVRSHVSLFTALALASLLAACRPAEIDPAPAVQTLPAAPTLPSPQEVPLPVVVLHDASPTPFDTAPGPPVATSPSHAALLPAAAPTATPAPGPSPVPQAVTLSVPSVIAETVDQAIAGDRTAPGGRWQWTVLPSGEPADLTLQLGAADAGILVALEPMAAVVPFADARETLAWQAEPPPDLPDCPSLEVVTGPCWLPWRLVRPPLKPLRLEGSLPWEDGYPANRAWTVRGEPAEAAAALAALLQPALATTNPVHLVAVGDVMLARGLGIRLRNGELEAPFAAFLDVLRSADIAVGNLESALGTGGTPAPKHYTFLAPPEAAQSVALAGIDVVSLANNHALDFGPETLLEGIGLLEDNNVVAVGAGENLGAARTPALLQAGGLTLAVLAYVDVPIEVSGFDTRAWIAGPDTPGLAWADPDAIRADVAAARSIADFVVVMLHSGYEYIEAPSLEQLAAAAAAVEGGADLVLGHHAHVLQGVGFGTRAVVLYGLGNFAFEIDGPPETALAHIWLDRTGIRYVSFEPAIIEAGGAPRPATADEADAIRSRVRWLTQFLPRLP